MSDTQVTARQALRALSAEQRKSLIRLANKGERHADPAVAAAAFRWSHDAQWERFPNRLPGWLLPLVGLVMAALWMWAQVAFDGPPELTVVPVVGFLLVIAIGLLAWAQTSTARTLRAVYPTE